MTAPPAPPNASPRRASGLAVWSLVAGVASVLCVGPGPALGVVAIALGLLAREEIRRSNGRLDGGGLAATGIVTGAFSFVALAGLLFAWERWAHGVKPPTGPSVVASAAPSSSSEPAPPPSSSAAAAPDDSADAEAPRTPPRAASAVRAVGAITVVDVAPGVSSLEAELRDQRTAAAAHGERMLVETTKGAGCKPCDGVASSLGDPRMQAALAGVRLVRIDTSVFAEDLDDLKIPAAIIPGFFLLDASLRITDAVHGGEWDDDIAANIAPVLGPFLRGTYTKRRDPWRGTPKPSGTVM